MNVNFIVFDANGTILRSGTCPENEVENQPKQGESVILGTAKQFDKVVNGRPTHDPALQSAHETRIADRALARAAQENKLKNIRDGMTPPGLAIQELAKILLGEE